MGGEFPWHILILISVIISVGLILFFMDRGE